MNLFLQVLKQEGLPLPEAEYKFHETRKCIFCGSEYKLVKRYKKFCSQKCYENAWRRNQDRLYRNCSVCGIKFYPAPPAGRRYCNKLCAKKGETIIKQRNNNGKGKGWSKGKIFVERKTGTFEACIRCGNKFYVFKCYKKRGINRGKFCSNKCKIAMLANVMNSRSKQGKYDIGGKEMFFRSSWEANYALYLNFLIKQKQIKKWEYETDTFWFEKIRRGVRSYKPDFKIFNFDDTIEYHEVKGYMDPRSITKIKRMGLYYPKIKLIVVDADYYRDVRNKIGKALNFY